MYFEISKVCVVVKILYLNINLKFSCPLNSLYVYFTMQTLSIYVVFCICNFKILLRPKTIWLISYITNISSFIECKNVEIYHFLACLNLKSGVLCFSLTVIFIHFLLLKCYKVCMLYPFCEEAIFFSIKIFFHWHL